MVIEEQLEPTSGKRRGRPRKQPAVDPNFAFAEVQPEVEVPDLVTANRGMRRNHPDTKLRVDQLAELLADKQPHAITEIAAQLFDPALTVKQRRDKLEVLLNATDRHGLICWQDNEEIGLLEDKRVSVYHPETEPAKNGAHPTTPAIAPEPALIPHVEQPMVEAFHPQPAQPAAREQAWRELAQYLVRISEEEAFGKEARLAAIRARLQKMLATE